MTQKFVEIEGIGQVLLAKRRGTRNLRLSIRPDGTVRIGLPNWAPYSAGLKFAADRREWIIDRLPERRAVLLADGHRIGKSYRIKFTAAPASSHPRTRVAANIINITAPPPHSDTNVQSAAQTACERALKREAERLLARRLSQLSDAHGFSYSGIKVKRLTSRWGSCSERGQISLSYFLVQLPWHLIDYVIIHELAHTEHLNHSQAFWRSVEKALPDAQQSRREIKNFRPVLAPV